MPKVLKGKPSRQRLSLRSQTARENAAHVLTRMREGYSLTSASAEYGVDRRTVEKFAGKALRKAESGRYTARASDNIVRELRVPAYGGYEVYQVRGSRAATQLSERLHAQRYFLATGDDSRMRKLRGTVVRDIYGREVPYLTDLDELERLGDAGAFSFESMYARRA